MPVMRTTIAVFRVRPGGYVGDGSLHPGVIDAAREAVGEARAADEVRDAFVARCGGVLAIVLTAIGDGAGLDEVAARAAGRAAKVATSLGQYRAVDDPPLAAARVTFEEGGADPVLCLVSASAAEGAWNIPLYRAFGDPMHSTGLVRDESMRRGFRFTGVSRGGACVSYDLPEDLHDLVGACVERRVVLRTVLSRAGGDTAAAASGSDDPVLVVRCHGGLPAIADMLAAVARPGGPHPLMPVSTNDDSTSASAVGRVIGLGFQMSDARLIGPRDMLADRMFDGARRRACDLAATT